MAIGESIYSSYLAWNILVSEFVIYLGLGGENQGLSLFMGWDLLSPMSVCFWYIRSGEEGLRSH